MAPFPIRSFADFRWYSSFNSTTIFGAADANDEIASVAPNLVIAPARPVDYLIRMKLIKLNIYAMTPKRLGEFKYASAMRW